MNPTEPPISPNPTTSSSAWPDEQALLMYLMEPELLAPNEHAALISWISASPEHADRLGELASQVCTIADHVQSLPTAIEPVVPLSRPSSRTRWSWLATAAATMLLATWWFTGSHRNRTGLTDEVAIAWATNHDSLVIGDTELWDSELWTSQDLEIMSELSTTDQIALEESFILEEGEQAIGFSDSEPPEWLVAAFVEGDIDRHFNSIETE